MRKFEQLHADVLEALPTCKSYKNLTQSGLIVEAYEKNNDTWRDVTLREQEKQRLEREIRQANRELAKETQ